jgi:hypothetical protein
VIAGLFPAVSVLQNFYQQLALRRSIFQTCEGAASMSRAHRLSFFSVL